MRHIIIDAFNLIFRTKELNERASKSIETAMKSMIEMLRAYSYTFPSFKFTVIFDGEAGEFSNPRKQIRILNSGDNEKADDIIKRIIREEIHTNDCYVISSDVELMNYAKINSCSAISSEEFIKMLKFESSKKNHAKARKICF